MTIEKKRAEDVALYTNDAALVVSPEGEIRLFLPHDIPGMDENTDVPAHVANVAACAVALKTPALMQLLLDSVYGDSDDED